MPTSTVEVSAPVVFLAPELDIFRARTRVPTYDWTRKNLRIVSGPYKGQLWTPDVTPYAHGIMEAFDRRHVRKIFILAPSQTGKSTLALGCMLSQECRRQDNLGIGLPDIEAVRKYITGRMHEYFSRIPALRRLLAEHDALTNYNVQLADGSAVMGMWSGSDSSMRAESMPYVLIEEEDAYGDPQAAAVMEERADAYHALEMSKIIRVCRPKGSEDTSNIWTDAKRQAQAWCVYEGRCPLCQSGVVMEHEHIVSVDGSREPGRIRQEKLGRYRCPQCGNLWNDALRNMAMRAGRWISTTGDLEDATIVAFHLRQWESPQVSLSDILARWWESQNNPRALQLWDNNVCAKPYKFVRVETDAALLAGRADPALGPGVVPAWAVALTFSADMQMDHFYWSVAAHGVTPSRLHILDYGRVQTWDELEQQAFATRYVATDGRHMGIWRGALDTGGTRHAKEEDSRTAQAYQWLRGLRPGVLYGTKGMSRTMPGVLVRVTSTEPTAEGRRLPGGMSLHLINGDAFKRLLFWRLAEGFDEEPVTFHAAADESYFRQIASERLETGRNGAEVWKRIRENHYLDCLVGHLALEWWQWSPSLASLAAGPRETAPAGDVAQRVAAVMGVRGGENV